MQILRPEEGESRAVQSHPEYAVVDAIFQTTSVGFEFGVSRDMYERLWVMGDVSRVQRVVDAKFLSKHLYG